MIQLVFASNNKNKIIEIQSILPDTIKILSLEEIGCFEDIPETADTIEGNAILKANHVTEKYGYNCFADDSGLEVDALNGAPGVFSARYAGDQKDDNDNIEKLLNELSSKKDRKANFKTVIALNLDNQNYLFKGIANGTITDSKKGTNGFGYDPVFQPEGFDKTFAEISLEEKSAISHRAKAVKQLISFLHTI